MNEREEGRGGHEAQGWPEAGSLQDKDQRGSARGHDPGTKSIGLEPLKQVAWHLEEVRQALSSIWGLGSCKHRFQETGLEPETLHLFYCFISLF